MDGGTSAGRKPSLFAQRMKNAKESKKKGVKKHSGGGDVGHLKRPAACFGEKSYVVSGPDADQIHKENIEKLSTMTAQEIEEERNKLITEIDPKLLDFLRSRKSKRNPTSDSDKKMSEDASTSIASKSDEKMDTETVVSETEAHDLSKRWPNLGALEDDKLKWMEQLPKSTPPETDIPYNARFSFDGTLLPYADENLDVRRGLHHHGEEPERPGYTLHELIQLSRSSVLQQRIIALNTLANIMEKANLYEECLDKPLVPMLLDAELFLMLRFSLDDPTRPVVTASLAALANLIVNHSDEICLDNLIGVSGGLHQPSLNTVISIPPNELAELKDPELLRLDLIRGALRTHLLHRFRYILDKMDPDETDIVNVLKCLIRIARHSVGAVEAISDCVGLLESVQRLLRNDSGHYYPDAMKLLRVIACRSEHFACHVFNNMSIMDTIQHILAGNAKEKQPEALRLMLESFYMWQTLLTYNLSTDHIAIFTPVLSRLLCVHIEHTDMESSIGDQEHGVALLTTLAIVFRLRHHVMQQFVQPVILVARKWVSQLTSRTSFTRPMCKLVGAALKCVAEIVKHDAASESDIEMKLEKFFQSSLYTEAISLLRKHSWLLQSDGDRSKGTGPDNLPSLGRAPCTLHLECPQPLFEGLVAFVIASNKPAVSMSFLRNQSWESYLGALTRRKRLCEIASHWYARQEIKLLSALLCSNLNCQAIEPGLFHHVALVMTTVIHKDDQLLLREIIQTTVFNKEYFLSHITSLTAQINHLTVKESSNSTDNTTTSTTTQSILLEAVKNIDDIKNCYSTHLRLHEMIVPNRPPSTLTTSEENGSEPILPSDWQFLPILNLYNNEGRARDPDKLAKCSLEWILIVENFHPEFAKVTPISARFSRLCCLFLAGADVYRSVGGFLKELLKVLLSNDEAMDLDGAVPGLNSFYDFYRQLVDHFLAVSYGDPVFGQYVLVPLQQKFNVRFRKLIWSEQVPLVRVLSTPVEELVMQIEEFLEPCETDTQLLATYLQYLGTGRVRKQWSPVLYKVAVHHVATYIVRYPDHNFTKSLLQGINTLGNQELRSLLLEYNQRKEIME